jgi:cytochrome c oxidase cbb3-type subunit 3
MSTDPHHQERPRGPHQARIRPAFDRLDDGQVAAIVGYLRELTGPATVVLPQTLPSGDAARGASLYERHCAQCHGQDGRGAALGTGVTLSRKRPFPVNPPAITNPGFLASASDPLLVYTILHGRPGTIMPGFAAQGLGKQDAVDLVPHLRRLWARQAHKRVQVIPGSLSHVVESDYDLQTTIGNVKRTLKGYNFRSFPDRQLQQGLTDIESVDPRQAALRFCNFNRLYDLLRMEPRLGVVLPCRITVVEDDDGQVRLYAPNLRTAAGWFNNGELRESFDALDDALLEILEEVTL